MARNPNPSRVTDELWWFWEQFQAMEPGAQLSGIYAGKPGYHNTRNLNHRNNYSVISAVDRAGSGDRASAIDITFPAAHRGDYRTIAKYSARMLASGRDPGDERGNYLRSFYGNADNDRQVEGWDFQAVRPATSDVSHLWHIHISFSRGHVNSMKAMRAVLSILAGEPVRAWRLKEALLLAPAKAKARPAPVDATLDDLLGADPLGVLVGGNTVDSALWTRAAKLCRERDELLHERVVLLAQYQNRG